MEIIDVSEKPESHVESSRGHCLSQNDKIYRSNETISYQSIILFKMLIRWFILIQIKINLLTLLDFE